MSIPQWLRRIFCKKSETQEKAKPAGDPEKSDLSAVAYVNINTISKNWDADAEKDGLDMEISLRDKDDHNVDFEDGSLSGRVNIKTEKGEEVYSKPHSISKRIKIPFEEIAAAEEKEGTLFIELTLPDGRTLKTKEKYIRIKP